MLASILSSIEINSSFLTKLASLSLIKLEDTTFDSNVVSGTVADVSHVSHVQPRVGNVNKISSSNVLDDYTVVCEGAALQGTFNGTVPQGIQAIVKNNNGELYILYEDGHVSGFNNRGVAKLSSDFNSLSGR